MNPVLRTAAFWQAYFTLEPEVLEAALAAQLDGLAADFVVRGEQVGTAVQRLVEFHFLCGERFSLVVQYQPDVNGCDKNLLLVDARSGTRWEMGWWDRARWHPYCLRVEELDTLLRFWARSDPRWAGPELPLLLLCQFVGLVPGDQVEVMRRRVEAAFEGLNVPPIWDREAHVPVYAPEDDYRWELDPELGWVFTSDDYCCYSIRNRPHVGSSEGGFPFEAWGEMMQEVEGRLGAG